MTLHIATPLTADQLAGLAALQNRPTLYEIEVVAPDGRKALLAYTARKSGLGLRSAVAGRAEALLAFLGANRDARFVATTGCRCHTHTITGHGLLRFSDRTKRDVVMEGTPLTYITDAACAGDYAAANAREIAAQRADAEKDEAMDLARYHASIQGTAS